MTQTSCNTVLDAFREQVKTQPEQPCSSLDKGFFLYLCTRYE
jgi:hypothetical protein